MIRRKKYFIKKKFQIGFAFRFLLLIVIEAGLIIGLFLYSSNNTITTGYVNSSLRVESTPHFFLVPLLLIMLIAGLGIAIAAMVVFTLLSHRIAGPLYRFEQFLNETTNGDLTKRVCLRKTDQLLELMEALNVTTSFFDKKIGKIKDTITELKKLLSQKENEANNEKIHKTIELLKEEIDHFKVTSISRD
jgi:methyl-accepting chemotaxis protein